MLPKIKNRKSLISLLFFPVIFFVLSSSIFAQSTSDNSVSDIQNQINQDNSQISDLNSKVNGLKGQLNSFLSNKNSLMSNYYAIESNISQTQQALDQEKNLIANLQSLDTQRQKDVQDLMNLRDERQRELYMSLQSSPIALIFSSKDFEDFSYNYILSEGTINDNMKTIATINSEIISIKSDEEKQKQEEQNLDSQMASLGNEKSQIETQLASVNGNINSTNSSIGGYSSQINVLNSQVAELDNQLKQLILSKQKETNAVAYTGQNGFSFYSKGFGTYVGMPQYGAYGMALQGYKAEKIASYYYTGTNVIASSGVDNNSITIKGYGTMSMKNYLAGIGEMVSWWPVEAIKAQIIVSRSYALYAIDHSPPGTAFASDTSFQNYIGGQAKMQYVVDTENEIVTNNGKDPIDAFFFSSSGDHTSSPSCAWYSCNTSSAYNSEYSYLQGISDPFDSPSFDPYALQQNVAMSPQQAANILNTALLLCANVSNCSIYNNAYSRYSSYINEDHGINGNASGNFPSVENQLINNGIAPISGLKLIKINYMGSANMVDSLEAVSDNYPNGVNVDGGIFFLAFNLSSPGNDILWGMRYYIQ